MSSFQASVTNAGTIAAVGTGVAISRNGLTNNGAIRSTGGAGVLLGGNVGTASTNAGTIQGATTGVQTSGYLTNTGSITATNADGVAVRLDAYGALYNNAGGVVGSGGQAVTGTLFNETVVNAGTINGNVAPTYNGQSGGSQRYVSQGGGVLNGNLVLGSDGVLFTDLANTGPGQFAGISGTATAANGAALRLRVSGAQSAVIGPVGPFAGATYELVSGASLTLTASSPVTRQVALAGSGSVDLAADLSTATATPAPAVVPLLSTTNSSGGAGALAITSRGTVSVTRGPGGTGAFGTGVSLSGGDTFTNVGTIAVTDRNANSFTTGVVGGTVVNTGLILLDGGIGVAGQLSNSGSITQITGGANAIGVGGDTVDNSGTNRVGSTAVIANNLNRISNSGTIASTGGVAIEGTGTGASATIANAAAGTISGMGGTAVRLYYGRLTNAGAISGTVDLGYYVPAYSGDSTRSNAGSIYVAAGGTIAGDLLFGNGADVLMQSGDSLGVSGIVGGGGGIDIYGRSLATSGTVAIDTSAVKNFEDALIRAVGTGTVATATAAGTFAGNLYANGNGSVVNQATIAGRLTTDLPYSFTLPYGVASGLFDNNAKLASLTNAGTISGGVASGAAAFTNTGTISSAGPYSATVTLANFDAGLSFTNSGTINTPVGASQGYAAVSASAATTLSITNSGQIAGGIDAMVFEFGDAAQKQLIVSNSGTISNGTSMPAARLSIAAAEDRITGGGIRIDNSGSIAARGSTASGGSAFGLVLDGPELAKAYTYALSNSGTITATAATGSNGAARQAVGLLVSGSSLSGTITNAAGGTISTAGGNAFALVVADTALDLNNAGTIGVSGTSRSVAIQTFECTHPTFVHVHDTNRPRSVSSSSGRCRACRMDTPGIISQLRSRLA